MERRKFIALTAMAGLGTLATRCTPAFKESDQTTGTTPARLRLSSQEGVAPGDSLNEKLDFLEANGFSGLEPGGRNLSERVTDIQKALEGRDMEISAVVAGFQGFLIAKDKEVRNLAMESIRRILEASGALGAQGLIVVPAFNHQDSLPHQESRAILVDQLQELGAHAKDHQTRILLEPLNRREAYFLRQLADAASICKDAQSGGVGCMGDFWHMTWEETSDMGAIISAGEYLYHMHIASRQNRRMPGEDSGDHYVDGFRGLKHIGYQQFISLECGSEGDRRETIPAAARLIREQWNQA